MNIEWDENKDRLNKSKHSISFSTAQLVFDDPQAISIQDRYENEEERWQTIGLISGVLVVLVAHTVLESKKGIVIRLISARKATKQERVRYEKSN